MRRIVLVFAFVFALAGTILACPAPLEGEEVALNQPAETALETKLEEAVQGLQFQSETDAPLRAFFWPCAQEQLTPATIAQLAEAKEFEPMETRDLDEFFANATEIEEWMEDNEKKTARQFQKLVEILKTELQDSKVYVFGATEKTVVIIGRVTDGFAGVITLVVET